MYSGTSSSRPVQEIVCIHERRLNTFLIPDSFQRMPEQQNRCFTNVLHAASETAPTEISVRLSRCASARCKRRGAVSISSIPRTLHASMKT